MAYMGGSIGHFGKSGQGEFLHVHPSPPYDVPMSPWLDRLKPKIRRLIAAGRDLLLPPSCLCCDRELVELPDGWPFCVECLARLGPERWHGCRQCGGEILDAGFAPSVCPRCRGVSLKFDAVIPLGNYHAGLRRVVLRMKRPSHHALTKVMGRLLFERRREPLVELQADLVAPVPMHWTRRLWRGMNNPDILAQCLAQSLGIPLRRDILVRHVNTPPQAGLPPSRRFENVRGAFRVRRPDAADGARILLVDDVLTTGATCSEAAKALKKAGAAAVVVAVVARAQGK